jgi:hypothetical protein
VAGRRAAFQRRVPRIAARPGTRRLKAESSNRDISQRSRGTPSGFEGRTADGTQSANSRVMKDRTFAKAMTQIAAEDQAARLREQELQRRLQQREKLRRGIAASLWVALIGCGFYYHAEFQQFATEHFFHRPKTGQVDPRTSKALQGIEAQAQKRDEVLNEITK